MCFHFMSPLSSLNSMTQFWGFFVTYSISYSEIFLHCLVLEAPVVGSLFFNSFTHARLASSYLLAFVFASSTIWKQTISHWQRISSMYDLLLINFNISFTPLCFFSLRHLSGFSYLLLADYSIPWFQIFSLIFQPHTIFIFWP